MVATSLVMCRFSGSGPVFSPLYHLLLLAQYLATVGTDLLGEQKNFNECCNQELTVESGNKSITVNHCLTSCLECF